MIEWDLHITYGITPYVLKAVLEYQSNQIMRIRIKGKTASLLMENNYPLICSKQPRKGIQWKLREGKLSGTDKHKDAVFLTCIMNELEFLIKKDFPR